MGRFDGLALIGAVTDLTELLGRRSTIDEFLTDLVSVVAEHMAADVCSVYLYDVEQDLLVLRATVGLNPGLVGSVRLASGEGLTGYALLNNSPVFETDAGNARLNKPIPDLGEEEYPVFLGVPIKRNNLGIGVLTLQYRARTEIEEQAKRALRSIASHLAATLENAAALYELQEAPRSHSSPRTGPLTTGLLNGTSASRGIAIGHLEYLDERVDSVALPAIHSLEEAIEASARQLQELQRRVDRTLSDVAAMIFSSHLLMLREESFVGQMIDLRDDGVDPGAAVQQVVDDFSRRFAAIPDPRFQEKIQDVQDLGHRILRNLRDHVEREGDYRGQVVAAREVFPSELVKLYLQSVEGLVFAGGGATSHVAILAQSLDLPVVATADPRLFSIPAGTRLVVDAEDGKVVIEPAGEILKVFRERISERRRRLSARNATPIPPDLSSADGRSIRLLANVNLVKDARASYALGAHGVGLYRSEFPFLIRNGFPTEEEQLTVYERVVQEMHGKPVTFRTLDLGGDKLLSTQVGREDNPFLGFRGIRFLLEHKDLFREQLRAMLRAGSEIDLGIQFPMISSLEEFLAARDEVHASIRELRSEEVRHNGNPHLGVMVELPAAVEIARDLAAEVDFLSIGTNDLIMYTLAADRANYRVAHIYRSVHPAVLRMIKRLADAVAPFERPLSVCGASAADPAMVTFYLGVGITTLSVDPGELHRVAGIVSNTDRGEAHKTAAAMLRARRQDELAEVIRELRSRYEGA
ncbi:MAG: phosphoenolpyruvate--protein phosphotransferase [Spirochaetales bacterium]|nr:phosphoenolpyruvate--protein phosphotransferase [Spirochaetales bacterium]